MYSASKPWVGRILACSLLLVALAWVSGVAVSREQTSGADEFRISCASCHGEDGKGSGQMASILTVQPADLTALARNNQGEFPESRVHGIIDGREAFQGHGDRAMPVWGIRYLMQHAVRYGSEGSEQAVRARIARLVDHIRSIQD